LYSSSYNYARNHGGGDYANCWPGCDFGAYHYTSGNNTATYHHDYNHHNNNHNKEKIKM
jgi:hypothetical protein